MKYMTGLFKNAMASCWIWSNGCKRLNKIHAMAFSSNPVIFIRKLCYFGGNEFYTIKKIMILNSNRPSQLLYLSNRNPSPQALTGALISVVCATSTFDAIISTSEDSTQRYEPIVFSHPFGQDCATLGSSHSLKS